jgi:hypothetical protein
MAHHKFSLKNQLFFLHTFTLSFASSLILLLLLLPLFFFIIIITATAALVEHTQEAGVANLKVVVDRELVPLVPEHHVVKENMCSLGFKLEISMFTFP